MKSSQASGPELVLRGPTGRNESFRKLLIDLDKAIAAIPVTGISPFYDDKLDPNWVPPERKP